MRQLRTLSFKQKPFFQDNQISWWACWQLLCLSLIINPASAQIIQPQPNLVRNNSLVVPHEDIRIPNSLIVQDLGTQEESLSAGTPQNLKIIINNYPIEHQGVNTLDLRLDYQAKKSAATSAKTETSRIYQLLNQLITNGGDSHVVKKDRSLIH